MYILYLNMHNNAKQFETIISLAEQGIIIINLEFSKDNAMILQSQFTFSCMIGAQEVSISQTGFFLSSVPLLRTFF